MPLPTDIADRLRWRVELNRPREGTYLYRLALEEIERLRSGVSAESELRAAMEAADKLATEAAAERDALREQNADLERRIEKAKAAWRKVKAERDDLERQLIAVDPRRKVSDGVEI